MDHARFMFDLNTLQPPRNICGVQDYNEIQNTHLCCQSINIDAWEPSVQMGRNNCWMKQRHSLAIFVRYNKIKIVNFDPGS